MRPLKKILCAFFAAILFASAVCISPVKAAADKEPTVDELYFPRVTIVEPEQLPDVPDVALAAVGFTVPTVRIIRGVKYDLSTCIAVSPSLSDVVWKSQDPGVVTVDENGVLCGMSIGSAWVTASVGRVQARIYVYVDANSLIVDPQEFMYTIRVNKYSNCITVYTLDEAGEYTVPVRAFRCSTGKNTPNGNQHIRNHNAWNGLYGDYEGMWSSWIVSMFLFHSVPFYHRTHTSLNEKMYNEFGTTCSGGCVRLQCLNAKWIFDNCPVGTPVIFYYDEENPGALGLPEAVRLPTGYGWDPTDPFEENPWLSGEPEIIGEKDITVAIGTEEVDYFSHLKGIDSLGNDVSDSIRVLSCVDTNTAGDYPIIYSLTDAAYKTVYAYAVVHVK